MLDDTNEIVKGLDPTHGGKLIPVFITDKNGIRRLVYKIPEEIDAQHTHLKNDDVFIDKKGNKLKLKKVIGFKQDKSSSGYLLKLEDSNKKEFLRYVHNLEIEETLNSKNKSLFADSTERTKALVDTEKTYQNQSEQDLVVKPIEVKDDLVTSVILNKNTKSITEKTTNVTDFLKENKPTEVTKIEPLKEQAMIEQKRLNSNKRVWSGYQNAVFDFVINGSGNAVINAVAGSGKTTTAVECVKRIPQNKEAIFLAFNKSIANELQAKMPNNATASTLHSFGLRCIKEKNPNFKIDDGKLKRHVDFLNASKKLFESSNKNKELQQKKAPYFEVDDEEYKYKSNVAKLVNLARQNLVKEREDLIELAIKHGIIDSEDEADNMPEAAKMVLIAMYNDRKSIDFEDMIFLPATDPDMKPKGSDFVFIDECQDLNKAQQKMLERMLENVKGSRFIAIGDPAQAIYGFRGSDEKSFANLQAMSNTITLPLTVTYRCGKNIVKYAKEMTGVEHLEAFENNEEGDVVENVSAKSLMDGDMVLSRKNAPAIAFCFYLLAQGKKASIVGKNIGDEIANGIERMCGKSLLYKEEGKQKVFEKMKNELQEVVKKLEKKGLSIDDIKKHNSYTNKKDKFDCIELFLNKHKNCNEAVKDIRNVFSDETKQGITISSAHKSKGLEADRVFIIDRENLPLKYSKMKDWQKIQEKNLEYVAYTRAKSLLGFIPNSDWKNPNEEEESFTKAIFNNKEEENCKELFEN